MSKAGRSPPPGSSDGEISALVETLHQTGHRLEELTHGELDSVVDRSGRMFLMRGVQEQLRQAEAGRQAAILNALPAHVALLDPLGVILSVNDAWRRFAGANVMQAPGAGLGLNYLDICDAATGDNAAEARQAADGIRSVLAGSAKNFSLEYPCHSLTEQRWFLLIAAPLGHAEPGGAVVMHLDVTSARLTEEKRRAAGQLLDNIVQNIPSAVQVKSVQNNFRIDLWNKAAEMMYGVPGTEAIGKTVHDLWPAADADRMHAADLELVATGQMQDFPDRLAQTRTRGDIRVHMRKVALFDDDGRTTHLLVVADDITAQLADQARLRENEARFRSLTELSSDWFWEQDAEHRFVRFSGGEGVKGWGPDQEKAVGLHRWDLGGVIPISSNWEEHKRLLDSHEPFRNFEYSRVLGDGRLQFVEASGEPIFDSAGAFTGYRGVATEITERKLAQKSLERQQSELRALFDLMPAMVWFKDTENGILRVNSRVAQAAGRTVAEIEGKPSHEIYPQDAARFYADDLEVMKSGLPKLAYVESMRAPDGRETWVQTDKVPYFASDGKVIGIVVMAQDITERKRAEHDLQRFRAAMDSSGDGIVLVDRESMRYVDVNQTLCDMVGYTRQELIGMTPMDLFDADRASLERDYDAIIADANSTPSKVEGHYRHRNGTLIPIETRRRAMRTDKGWIIVGSARDITERTRAALELRESERRLSDMLGNVELISVMLDRGARLTYCNEYFLGLTGWRREEVIGRSWFELFAPAALGDTKPAFQALLANLPEARHLENEIVTRTGDRRLIRWNNSVLRTGAGEVVGTASIGEDITEQKLADVKILRLNRVYAMLSGISGLIVRVQDRDELFREACRVAVEAGHFAKAWVGLVEPGARNFRMAAALGGDPEFFTQLEAGLLNQLLAAQGLVARTLATQRPVISNDMANDPEVLLKDFAGRGGARSLAMLPLVVAGESVGVFVLNADTPDFFDEEEIKLLAELAGNIAHAIDNIDKAEKLDRTTRVNAVLSSVNSAIVRTRDPDALFTEICRIAISEGDFALARVVSIDAGGQARIAATSEADPTAIQKIIDDHNADPANSPNLLGQVIRSGKARVSNDVAGDPRMPNRELLTRDGNYAVALLPIVTEKRVTGVMILRARELGAFNADEMHLLNELISNVTFALELMVKRKELDYLAYYDPLTGLANRTLFLERVAQFLRSAVSGGHKLGLFLIDLERFRNINDSLGRPAGDALLQQVAGLLSRGIDSPGQLARVGVDQFAVVMPALTREGNVAHFIEKRIQAFVNHPFVLNNAEYRIAVKVGAALFPNDGVDADSLLKNAEAALKNAKHSGDKFLFYTQTMNEKVAGKLTLENQLRQALENGEYVLHYQPKVQLSSGKLMGAEALIRWNNPRTGLMPPGQFIPVLEETGLIYDVGRWALRQAIGDYLRWRAAGLPAVRLAVNVSPMQLRNPGFITEVEQALGVDAGAAAGLELEITESLIMENVKRSIDSLRAIRDLGVHVAIDDFGTGYSSLSHLARLPVDTLKIDRSFIIEMTSGPDGLALVSTIINLAHSMKLNVVAEGVETEEQSRLLRLLSCDEMQGFLFSRPVPSEEFATRFLTPPPGP